MTKLDRAIRFAVNAHEGQKRKGKDRPYILHPLEVLTVVSSLTEDEDVLCAAVLHDTVEDTSVTPEEIGRAFGARVRALVAAESENKREDQDAGTTWRIRKQETVDHLTAAERDVQLICLGDKLSNLREIARDYADSGDGLWQRFNQKDKRRHAWYYGAVFAILEESFGEVPPIREYRKLLRAVFQQSGAGTETA